MGPGAGVAGPKSRGDNVFFAEDVPAIGTCAVPVQCTVSDGRRSVVHAGEAQQMEPRLVYIHLNSGVGQGTMPALRCRVVQLRQAGGSVSM